MSLNSLEAYSKNLENHQIPEPSKELLTKFKSLEPINKEELKQIASSVLKRVSASDLKTVENDYPVTFFQATKLRDLIDVNHAYVATEKLNVFRQTIPWFTYGFGICKKDESNYLIESRTCNMYRAEEVLTRASEKQIKDIFSQLMIAVAAAHSVGVINIPPVFRMTRTNLIDITVSEIVIPTNGFIPIFIDFGPACIFEKDKVISLGTTCFNDTPYPDLKDEFNRFRNDFFNLLSVYRKKMNLSKEEFPDPDINTINSVSHVPKRIANLPIFPVPVPIPVPPLDLPFAEADVRINKNGMPVILINNLIGAISARVNTLSNWQSQFSNTSDPNYGHVRDCLAHVIERHEREIVLLGDNHEFDSQVCKLQNSQNDKSGYHQSEYHTRIINIINARLPQEASFVELAVPGVIQSAEEYNISARRLWLLIKTRIYLTSARAIIILNKHNNLKIELCATIRKLDGKIQELLENILEAHASKSMQIDKTLFDEPSVNFMFKKDSPPPIPNLVTDVIIHILEPIKPNK